LSIGKNNLDAAGTILNELNNDIKFNIEINGNNELHTISELYDLYDKGVLSFKKILRTVIDQGVEKSNNILASKSVLESIYQFLYAPKGLRNSIFA